MTHRGVDDVQAALAGRRCNDLDGAHCPRERRVVVASRPANVGRMRMVDTAPNVGLHRVITSSSAVGVSLFAILMVDRSEASHANTASDRILEV